MDNLNQEQKDLNSQLANVDPKDTNLEKQAGEEACATSLKVQEDNLNPQDTKLSSLKKLETELLQKLAQLSDKETELSALISNFKVEKEQFELEKQQQLRELKQSALQQQSKLAKEQETYLQQVLDEKLLDIAEQEKEAKAKSDERLKEYLEAQEQIRKNKNAEIAQELLKRQTELEDFLQKYKENSLKQTNCLEENLKLKEDKLDALQKDLESQDAQIKARLKQCSIMEQTLKNREANLVPTAQSLAQDAIQVLEDKLATKDSIIAALREENRNLSVSQSNFELLKQKLGDKEPEALLSELKDQELSINKLRQDLSERPVQLQKHYEELSQKEQILKKSFEDLKNKNLELQKITLEQADHEYQLDTMRQENTHLQQQLSVEKTQNSFLKLELERLQTMFGDPASREDRIKSLEIPYIKQSPIFKEDDFNHLDSELRWLNNISKKCKEYGFIFPNRLLYAFHTSLKTAEWSALTVLAGVSGTGKSKLPQLYATFGGLNFMLLSVQPNWDSQEAMLGFFNSIENVFDAQPVLRFLVQSQHEIDDKYPYGMKGALNLVLLDEMNLAHVELYFAEFLSKLELRHGVKGDHLPNIEVKIGSNLEPYPLKLERNVLWVGTMNEDETTKSLSDKVLDRSGLIHFPRPKALNDLTTFKNVPHSSDSLLPVNVWQRNWCQFKGKWQGQIEFTPEEIKPFKDFIEKINAALGKAGRALGHRVWQSIEAYMLNYPAVIKLKKTQGTSPEELKHAMSIAFEDELVAKVMPKLRGIETRGLTKTDCLDVIEQMLADENYSILDDFKMACTLGYGQFMWNSASYLDQNGDDVGIDLNSIETQY